MAPLRRNWYGSTATYLQACKQACDGGVDAHHCVGFDDRRVDPRCDGQKCCAFYASRDHFFSPSTRTYVLNLHEHVSTSGGAGGKSLFGPEVWTYEGGADEYDYADGDEEFSLQAAQGAVTNADADAPAQTHGKDAAEEGRAALAASAAALDRVRLSTGAFVGGCFATLAVGLALGVLLYGANGWICTRAACRRAPHSKGGKFPVRNRGLDSIDGSFSFQRGANSGRSTIGVSGQPAQLAATLRP